MEISSYYTPCSQKNRRAERRSDIIQYYTEKGLKVLDLSSFENKNKFLEGTGSMVLDRSYKIAYTSLSQRTDQDVLNEFCAKTGYTPITFHSYQKVEQSLKPIYHTNVMMCVTKELVIICLDVVTDQSEKEKTETTNQKKRVKN
jgi:hypothetical protein